MIGSLVKVRNKKDRLGIVTRQSRQRGGISYYGILFADNGERWVCSLKNLEIL